MHFSFYLVICWSKIPRLLRNDEILIHQWMSYIFQSIKEKEKVLILPLASSSHQSFTSVRIRMCIKRMTSSFEIPSREMVIYLCVFTDYTEHALLLKNEWMSNDHQEGPWTSSLATDSCNRCWLSPATHHAARAGAFLTATGPAQSFTKCPDLRQTPEQREGSSRGPQGPALDSLPVLPQS